MNDDALAWMTFFASVRGIGFHPKNEPRLRRSIDEDAAEADAMLNVFRQRFPTWQPGTDTRPSGLRDAHSHKPSATSSSPTPAAWPLGTCDG